jgi:hypothetical protein
MILLPEIKITKWKNKFLFFSARYMFWEKKPENQLIKKSGFMDEWLYISIILKYSFLVIFIDYSINIVWWYSSCIYLWLWEFARDVWAYWKSTASMVLCQTVLFAFAWWGPDAILSWILRIKCYKHKSCCVPLLLTWVSSYDHMVSIIVVCFVTAGAILLKLGVMIWASSNYAWMFFSFFAIWPTCTFWPPSGHLENQTFVIFKLTVVGRVTKF